MLLKLLKLFSILAAVWLCSRPEAMAQSPQRPWIRVTIPDAYCGNGDPYRVFVDPSQGMQRLAVVLQGGGACWDMATCSTGVTTDLTGQEEVSVKYGIVSTDPKQSPVANWSMAFFPYCTGDMFASDHTTRYWGVKKVRHQGKSNLQKAFAYLEKMALIQWQQPRQLLLYGVSAGALGLMLNLPWIDEQYTSPDQDRSVLLDGLGAHWESYVWKRFRQRRIDDIVASLTQLGVPFEPENGPLAQYAIDVCRRFGNYRFGVFQGTMDIVMGTFFGYMTPLQHRRKVLGAQGIYQTSLDPKDNCAVWLHDSPIHTFFQGDLQGMHQLQSTDGMSVYNFAQRIIYSSAGPNHR
jgi:hypothetical protein